MGRPTVALKDHNRFNKMCVFFKSFGHNFFYDNGTLDKAIPEVL